MRDLALTSWRSPQPAAGMRRRPAGTSGRPGSRQASLLARPPRHPHRERAGQDGAPRNARFHRRLPACTRGSSSGSRPAPRTARCPARSAPLSRRGRRTHRRPRSTRRSRWFPRPATRWGAPLPAAGSFRRPARLGGRPRRGAAGTHRDRPGRRGGRRAGPRPPRSRPSPARARAPHRTPQVAPPALRPGR